MSSEWMENHMHIRPELTISFSLLLHNANTPYPARFSAQGYYDGFLFYRRTGPRAFPR